MRRINLAAAFGAGLSGQAATCGSGTVNPSGVCEIGATNDDFVSAPLQPKQNEQVGKDDGIFAGKLRVDDPFESGAADIGFSVCGTVSKSAGGGEFGVDAETFGMHDHQMIVPKGPAGGRMPATIAASSSTPARPRATSTRRSARPSAT